MNIIPLPQNVLNEQGTFLLNKSPLIGHVGCENIVEYLSIQLKNRYSINLQPSQAREQCHIWLQVQPPQDPLEQLEQESYQLNILTDSGIEIVSPSQRGVFYGVQSLLWLLPINPNQQINIQCVKIHDKPCYKWRGALLDVGRHFYSVEFVKKWIDLLAYYKMNVFHWHLTEDQGWRIEIKSKERLQSVASKRGRDNYGGYYTQEEVKSIVKYAQSRFIDIVPEIELPGHCGAALAAYPHLTCSQYMPHVPAVWGVHEDIYCAGRESTFEFLFDVFKEVVELFPFNYIHIGGDEVPKIKWETCAHCQDRMKKENIPNEAKLQTWFINRVSEVLQTKYHKNIIGWDEIIEGGIPRGATVMSWRGVSGGYIAAQRGHDCIMTPTNHCYFDYKQGHGQHEPGAYYAVLTLKQVYNFDPLSNVRIKQSSKDAQQQAERGHQIAQEKQDEKRHTTGQGDTSECSNMSTQQATQAPDNNTQGVKLQNYDANDEGMVDSNPQIVSAAYEEGDADVSMVSKTRFGAGEADGDEVVMTGDGIVQVSAALECLQGRVNMVQSSLSRLFGEFDPKQSSFDDVEQQLNAINEIRALLVQARRMQDGDLLIHQADKDKMLSISRYLEQLIKHHCQKSCAQIIEADCDSQSQAADDEECPACDERRYEFELTQEQCSRIIGGQANLWTEHISSEHIAEYMTVPRLAALSECLWTPTKQKNWAQFIERAQHHLPVLGSMGYICRQLDQGCLQASETNSKVTRGSGYSDDVNSSKDKTNQIAREEQEINMPN